MSRMSEHRREDCKVSRAGGRAIGWVNGRNIQLEYRWAPGGQTDVLKRTAEMVAGAPDLGGKDGHSQRRT